MINDDVLIGYSRRNPRPGLDWIEQAQRLFRDIRFIRDRDFTGLGLNDMDLIESWKVEPGNRIVLPGNSVEASIVGIVLRKNLENDAIELEIEALGCGTDEVRDPDRKLRYGTKIYPCLRDYDWVLRINSKARANAGSLYYFFSKAPRDNRINRSEDPEIATRMIIGSLRSNLLGDTRVRAQYMHLLRRIFKEIERLENPAVVLREIWTAGEKQIDKIKKIITEYEG